MPRRFAPISDRIEVYELVRGIVEGGRFTGVSDLRGQLKACGHILPSRETLRRWALAKTSPFSGKRIFDTLPSEELSTFLGVYLGDGWRDESDGGKRIRLKVRSRDLAEEFATAATKILGKTNAYTVWTTVDDGGPWYNVKVTSFMLYEFLGNDLDDLRSVLELFPIAFLRGFSTAEGCPTVDISRKGPGLHVGVVISNSDKHLLELSRDLLTGLGFHPGKIRLNIPAGKRTNIGVATLAGWLLNLSRLAEVRRFADSIGFADADKQRKLIDALTLIEQHGALDAARRWPESYDKRGKRWIRKP